MRRTGCGGSRLGPTTRSSKLSNNFEVRAQGPAVIWSSLVPGVYAFADAGYYNGFFHDPGNTPGGFLASIGMGVSLDVFDLVNVTGYVALPVYGREVDGAQYAINLGLAF